MGSGSAIIMCKELASLLDHDSTSVDKVDSS